MDERVRFENWVVFNNAHPVVTIVDAQASGSLEHQFMRENGGPHTNPETGATNTPQRPFNSSKCAFGGEDIVRMATQGQPEARDFVEALLDVVEDQLRGQRPFASAMRFVVNTGTPAVKGRWMFMVKMTEPIVADIRLVKDTDTKAWSYTIQRLVAQATRRRSYDQLQNHMPGERHLDL